MIEINPVEKLGYIEGFGKSTFGANRFEKLLQNEPHIIEDDISHYIGYIPYFLKKIMICIMERVNMRRESIFLKVMGDSSIDVYANGVLNLKQFSQNFEKIMVDNNLDGFICPASATPAFKHYESKEIAMTVLINAIPNILDYPSTVIPVTKVSKADLEEDYNDPYYLNDHFVQETRKTLADSEGMPVAIQVCTRSFRDEECLAIGKIIDDAIKKYGE